MSITGSSPGVQLQLPDEWDSNLAKKNIGVSAFVETDRCNPQWIDKCNEMDAVIVPSKFTDQLKRRNQCIVAHPVSNMDKECGILLYKLLVIKEHDCFTLCLFCYIFDYSVTHRTIAL